MIEFVEIVDGKVMVGAKKPESLNRLPEGHEENELITIHEKYDMDEHEAGLRPVVNARLCKTTGDIDIVNKQGKIINTLVGVKSGQKVKTKLTPEGKAITKIL